MELKMDGDENGQLAEEYHPQRTPPPSGPHVAKDKNEPYRVNYKLLPIKGYYFVFMSAVGSLLPYISVFMRQLGLTVQETAIIYGIMPFVGFFMRPLIGAVADKYKKHKVVHIGVTVLTGIFYFLLVFVPSRPSFQDSLIIETKFECNTYDSFIQDCQDSNISKPDCHFGISHLLRNSMINNSPNDTVVDDNSSKNDSSNLKPRACSFTCQSDRSEFQVCITNSSGPLQPSLCNGTLVQGKHLPFVVPNIDNLLAREVSRDRYSVGSMECRDYDLKNFLYEKNSSHQAFQALCHRELSLVCHVNCSDGDGPLECDEDKVATKKPFDSTFFMFFFLFLVANITFAPIFPILDAAAYNLLGEDRHLWGRQRVWGTLGFALFAVGSTFIVYMLTQKSGGNVDYSICFYLFFIMSLGAAVIAYFIDMSDDIKCGQFVKNVCKLLSYPQVLTFLCVVMYFGMIIGGLEAFLFIYLSELGGPPLLFGSILMVNCSAELPLMWLAGKIIEGIGLIGCLYLALVCYSVRLFWYSVISEPWLALLVEPCHGVTFGLMYAAAATYASMIAPPGMSSTVQGLLGGVHFGFGKGIGSLVTGYMISSISHRWTWRIYSLLSLAILAVYFLLNKFVFPSSVANASQAQQTGNAEDKDAGEKPELKGQKQGLINSNSQVSGPV